MTTVDGVFAAGDVVTGSKTVVHAVEGAKRVAESMLEYLDAKADAGDVEKEPLGYIHHVHGIMDV